MRVKEREGCPLRFARCSKNRSGVNGRAQKFTYLTCTSVLSRATSRNPLNLFPATHQNTRHPLQRANLSGHRPRSRVGPQTGADPGFTNPPSLRAPQTGGISPMHDRSSARLAVPTPVYLQREQIQRTGHPNCQASVITSTATTFHRQRPDGQYG